MLVGCGTPRPARIGRSLALPNGEPRTPCESEDWYDLAPARIEARAQSGVGNYQVHYFKDYEGIGVFKVGKDQPEPLEGLWARLGEPELQRRHEERLEPVKAAQRHSLYWSLGSLGGIAAGLGTAVALVDKNDTAASVAGVTGLVAGVVGLVGALVSAPTARDVLDANARASLLMPGEDDVFAGRRGVNTLNSVRRLQCGGRPVAFTEERPADSRVAEEAVPASKPHVAEEAVPASQPRDAQQPATPVKARGEPQKPITVWPPPSSP
ncbi:hypothetical protein D7X96_05495 [Corallococcus interemptor]|uniref:Uncharacterized protein n=1 Tax=Corallococcus interemptor TaxID=2316720 RepID=A0A3A8QX23_9BACT|nr:hypothetical protein [Corallococcus interemptor]RKH72268.1 hypothetical protein D7X96_05495 [Corallococcus interemptor]